MAASTTTRNKTEWLEPETLARILAGVTKLATVLAKLKKRLPKNHGPKRDTKDLSQEMEQLAKACQQLANQLSQHVSLHVKFQDAVAGLVGVVSTLVTGQTNVNKIATIVISHDKRLRTLELPGGRRKSAPVRKEVEAPKTEGL